jgi:hypothetical protein
LLEQLLKAPADRTSAGFYYLGLDERRTNLLHQYAVRLQNNDETLPIGDDNESVMGENKKLKDEIAQWKDVFARQQVLRSEADEKYQRLLEKDKHADISEVLNELREIRVNYNMRDVHPTLLPLPPAAPVVPPTPLPSGPMSWYPPPGTLPPLPPPHPSVAHAGMPFALAAAPAFLPPVPVLPSQPNVAWDGTARPQGYPTSGSTVPSSSGVRSAVTLATIAPTGQPFVAAAAPSGGASSGAGGGYSPYAYAPDMYATGCPESKLVFAHTSRLSPSDKHALLKRLQRDLFVRHLQQLMPSLPDAKRKRAMVRHRREQRKRREAVKTAKATSDTADNELDREPVRGESKDGKIPVVGTEATWDDDEAAIEEQLRNERAAHLREIEQTLGAIISDEYGFLTHQSAKDGGPGGVDGDDDAMGFDLMLEGGDADDITSTNTGIPTGSGSDVKSAVSVARRRLLGCLGELLETERTLARANNELEIYKVRFERLAAKQQMLYDEYSRTRHEWAEEKVALKRANHQLQRAKDDVDLELARRADVKTLKSAVTAAVNKSIDMAKKEAGASGADASSEVKGSATDTSTVDLDFATDPSVELARRVLVLEVQEKISNRQMVSLRDDLSASEARERAIGTELVDMEKVLRTRISELVRARDSAEARASSLEELTQSWVPREELTRLAKQHHALRVRHAELLGTQSHSMKMEVINKDLMRDHDAINRRAHELEEQKTTAHEQLAKLQKRLEEVIAIDKEEKKMKQRRARAVGATGGGDDDESSLGVSYVSPRDTRQQSVAPLLAKIADLEVKESSARKKALRLEATSTKQLEQIHVMEEDITTLEKKLNEIQSSYQVEREMVASLRLKLEGSVSYATANRLHVDIQGLQGENQSLRADLQAQKEVAEIASRQAMDVLQIPGHPQSDGVALQCASLKEAILELEGKSDDQSIVAKLHRKLMRLRLDQDHALKAATSKNDELVKAQALVLKMEKQLEQRATDVYRLQREFRRRLAEKEKELLEWQEKATPGLSLAQAESLQQANVAMTVRLEAERKNAMNEKEDAEKLRLQVAELRVLLTAQEDLTRTLMKRRTTIDPLTGDETPRSNVSSPSSSARGPSSLLTTSGRGGRRDHQIQLGVLDAEEYEMRLKQKAVEWTDKVTFLKPILESYLYTNVTLLSNRSKN